MRDLPGFYWDEERQRYFALAQENVARDLSRCDPRRVSAHDEPAHIRADAFVFLSDANNRMASTCPRRDRTHLGANAPENRRRSGKGASSSRVRDPPGDGSRRKKKRGGERARERGADASSRRDPFSSSRRGVAAPSERKPKDAQKQPGPSREKNSASPFDALRARALGMALGGKNLRGRRVASPSDIVAAARRAHVRGLTLAGEIGADAFGHGFELAVDPLRVGHALEHARANATDSIVTPDRILLAGAPHARHESSGNAHSYVKRLRSVDYTGKGWGVAETAVCERRERACVDDAFANRALASSFMARETQRMRAVEWATARNAGLTGVMGFDDAAGTPDGAPGSDDDSEEDADFATQHGATSHACLSTSLMGDGANRDPARPPGGVAAISCLRWRGADARGSRRRTAETRRALFAAGDAPGRFREFKNTHPGFSTPPSRRAQARSRASQSHGLLLYDVRANRAVRRVERRWFPSRCAATPSPSRATSARTPAASLAPGARAETFAVGLRDGTLAFVDSRARRPSYFTARGDALKAAGGFSFVTDLVALRETPGMLVAASADGGLRVWGARHAGAPARVLARGSPARVFDTRRRCAVDARERFVAFDQTHHVRAVAGRPSTAREVEALAVWDLGRGRRRGGASASPRRAHPPRWRRRWRWRRSRACASGRERANVCGCTSRNKRWGRGETPASGSGVSRRRAFYVARQLVLDRILRRYASGLLAHFLRRRNLAHSAWHFG